jgi:hypothetical protein
MAIKGLTPQLAERGKIKIGGLGDERKKQGSNETYRLPVKHDYITITTMQRDQAGRLIPDTTLMEKIRQAQNVQKLTEIPVRLLYDDIDLNFPTRYSCYKGNQCWCTGDGERAQRLGEGEIPDTTPGTVRLAKPNEYGTVSCPCERVESTYAQRDKCKPMGTLQVLLEGVDRVGGVWRFRTTSWNSVNAILSSLVLIKTITGGVLSGILLHLVLSPKTVTVPAGPTAGQNMVVYVMSLEYRGPEEKLAELGYDITKKRIDRQIRMETLEVEARKLLVAPHQEAPQDQAETAAEFYHEAADVGFTAPPGPYVPENLNTAPAGDGAPKKPRAAAAKAGPGPQPPQGTKRTEPQPVTLPELMEMCHKGQELPLQLPIRSHKPGMGNLAILKEWERQPEGESWSYSLVLELAPNLKEIADGLTPEMVVKSFAEAGITVTVANLKVLGADDRFSSAPTTPPPVTGPCDYHPDLPATWRDEQGLQRCTNCPGPTQQQEEVIPPGWEGTPGPAITPPPPQARGNSRPQDARKSLF